MNYCPYTNSSPPTCQVLSPLLMLRGKRGEEFRRKLIRAFNEMPQEGQEVVKAIEDFVAEFTETLLKVAEIIPWQFIAIKGTLLNYPEICLNVQELTLTEQQYQELRQLGYDVDWGCIGACGYGSLEVEEHGDIITFTVHPCMCHYPSQYFLVLKPRRGGEQR